MIVDIKWAFRNTLYYLNYWRITRKTCSCNTLIFIFDPNRKHPGLLDRIKGCVGAYNIAKDNHRELKILFEEGSYFTKYIEPNIVDWNISGTDVSYNFLESRIINYSGRKDYVCLDPHILQYHIYNYRGYDIRVFKKISHYAELWSKDYNELFRPTKLLLELLQKQPYEENHYIVVHIRFVNALELAEPKYHGHPLSDDKKKLLMDKCINAIRDIQKQYNLPVCVLSDSNLFLRYYGGNGLNGQVGHISYNPTKDVYEKTFVDLYLIARAKIVIQLTNKDLYRSAFSKFGSMIGLKEFVLHEI